MTVRRLISAAAITIWSVAAFAQTPPSPATPQPPTATDPARAGSPACAPNALPGQGDPSSNTVGRTNEGLSDRLAKSDGVLCPPAGIDPEIRAPTPDVGKMPVIPPPGSPGGDPTIRPK